MLLAVIKHSSAAASAKWHFSEKAPIKLYAFSFFSSYLWFLDTTAKGDGKSINESNQPKNIVNWFCWSAVLAFVTFSKMSTGYLLMDYFLYKINSLINNYCIKIIFK